MVVIHGQEFLLEVFAGQNWRKNGLAGKTRNSLEAIAPVNLWLIGFYHFIEGMARI